MTEFVYKGSVVGEEGKNMFWDILFKAYKQGVSFLDPGRKFFKCLKIQCFKQKLSKTDK